MNAKHRARRAASFLLRPYRHPYVVGAASRGALALPPNQSTELSGHVLIAAPGRGSVGDQAMVESFLENVDGPVSLVARKAEDASVPEKHRDRTSIVVLPYLIYGGAFGHAGDMRRFAGSLSNVKSVSIVGADVMDGAYSASASANRARVAEFAAKAGVDARILGFSWNGNAHRLPASYLRRAAAAGVTLYLRDPVSYRRAELGGFQNAVLAADMVFASDSRSGHVWKPGFVEQLQVEPYALVNVRPYSGGDTKRIIQEYRAVVQHLTAEGLRVIIVLHDTRPVNGDDDVCAQLAAAVEGPRVTFIDQLLSPQEMRTLAAESTLAVSGRMHLGVIALSQGTPAIVLSVQGKVDGLMESFERPTWSVERSPGFAEAVIAEVEDVLRDPSGHEQHIRDMLPRVRERSLRNFQFEGATP